MSNDIDKKLWRIQEQAMDKSVSSKSTELHKDELTEIREYQRLYELLEQQSVKQQSSPLLAERITKKISQHHRKQRTSKLLTYLVCSLMVVAMIVGQIVLLPQSALLNQLSQSIPLPILLSALFASGLSGFILSRFVERNTPPE